MWGFLWTAFYGLLGFAVLRQSTSMQDEAGERLGLVMFVSWLISAAALALFGKSDAWTVITIADTALALLVIWDATRRPSDRAVYVIALFVLELVIHGCAGALGVVGSGPYVLLLNAVYSAQVLAAGGPGVGEILTRLRPRRVRARAHRLGRP